MACRQARNIGFLPPAAEYLVCDVANDNRPLWKPPEWLANMFGIISCCAAQLAWSAFLIAQLSH